MKLPDEHGIGFVEIVFLEERDVVAILFFDFSCFEVRFEQLIRNGVHHHQTRGFVGFLF